jgi:glucosamine kinase
MVRKPENIILIADSGSTKTDWRLLDQDRNEYHFKTTGFNPYFQDTSAIFNTINRDLIPDIAELSIPGINSSRLYVYFYGAGCSSEGKCGVVRKALQQSFPGANVEVDHDLLAAARALCGKKEGIAAILGTGSNSCYYDGEKIVQNVASLGFILGDEGSGAHIGKLFMQDYLNQDMPKNIAEKFYDSYRLNKELILDSVYKKEMPSKFLASFSKFINENKNEQYLSDLIDLSFNQFFNKHICKYSNHKDVSLNCVGSIAFYYTDILLSIAGKKGITIEKVIESPIKDLTRYHLDLG